MQDSSIPSAASRRACAAPATMRSIAIATRAALRIGRVGKLMIATSERRACSAVRSLAGAAPSHGVDDLVLARRAGGARNASPICIAERRCTRRRPASSTPTR